jgi:hypothetical protein
MNKHKLLALLLAVVMICGLLPVTALAGTEDDHANQVRVIVENTTYPKADGAAWDGTLVDTWVDLTNDSTMMNCVAAALSAKGYTQSGAESNYISSINGLAASGMGGWMGTLNDWFANEGFDAFTVAGGTLSAGDEIRIMYSLAFGEDLGGSWSNNDKTLSALAFSAGTLNTAFGKDTHSYTLTVPFGTTGVVVTPTASNKYFQVHTSIGSTEYKRTASVPVTDGTVITVKCGDPAWPTMNGGDYGSADAVPAETYTITVAQAQEPVTLTSLLVHTGTTPSKTNVLMQNQGDDYEASVVFDTAVRSYTLPAQLDSVTQLRFRPLAENGATTVLHYGSSSKDITWESGTSKWANCLSAGKNTLELVVTPPEGSSKAAQTYTLTVDCLPTLTALSASTGGAPLYLDKAFSMSTTDYTLTVPDSATSVELNATARSENYTVTYNGLSDPHVDITGKNKIDVVVTVGTGEGALSHTYTILLNRASARTLSVRAIPADATVMVYDQNGASVPANSDGTFTGLFAQASYTYTVSKYGYLAQSGTVDANGGTLNVTLEKASDGLAEVSAAWKNFRNSDVNMGITGASTPIVKEDTALLWHAKLGTGWNAAPSAQIIVDDALVVMSGTKLYKLDLSTGAVLASGDMTAAPNFGYTPPTYAEGMIFCPLANGTIQAFNATTLESVWIYRDALGGQSLSPITYSGGYLYTGFWNGETKSANYVCLSVTDEDPSRADEVKTAVWKHAQPGGFYWAGSVAVGDALIVGTDDGTGGAVGNSQVYSFNKYTGQVISRVELTGMGDQRSSMAYDQASGRLYFTTKGGFLCSLALDAKTGTLGGLKSVDYHAQSSSTPVVYGGKVYFGTGSGISSTGSSGNFVCASADTLEMVFAVGLLGYPQCSMLLSTAYENTGSLYFYSTYNKTPGGISMIKVSVDADSAEDAELIELYDAAGFSQYCITSVICGTDGTLYYKNDSGTIFAVGVPKATQVFNLIAAIGTVSAQSGGAITQARNAYNALSEADRLSVTNYSVLTAAEKAYDTVCAALVTKLIAAIGTVTLDSKAAIAAARSAYDALTAVQKAQVGNASLLTAAQQALEALERAAQETPSVSQPSVSQPSTSQPTRPGTSSAPQQEASPTGGTDGAPQEETTTTPLEPLVDEDLLSATQRQHSLTWLWIALAVVGVGGIVSLVLVRKRHSK